jgi:hypothetical protein
MSLPEGLDETYERILSNIPKGYRKSAIRILQFLTFSERPLRLDETVDAIAVFPDRTPAFEHKNRMRRPLRQGDMKRMYKNCSWHISR